MGERDRERKGGNGGERKRGKERTGRKEGERVRKEKTIRSSIYCSHCSPFRFFSR